jgi:hypothetical protein
LVFVRRVAIVECDLIDGRRTGTGGTLSRGFGCRHGQAHDTIAGCRPDLRERYRLGQYRAVHFGGQIVSVRNNLHRLKPMPKLYGTITAQKRGKVTEKCGASHAGAVRLNATVGGTPFRHNGLRVILQQRILKQCVAAIHAGIENADRRSIGGSRPQPAL